VKHDRFPAVWIPDPATRDLRARVTHRMRLVRMRTMVKNGLHAIAMNRRLTLGPSLWSPRGLAQLQGLALAPHTTQRRDESLQRLAWLTARIEALEMDPAGAEPLRGQRAVEPLDCRVADHHVPGRRS
jgi:transposase